MKRATALSLAFLLCGTMLTAQNAQQQSSNFVINLPASTCPVGMRASQGVSSHLLAVRGDQQRVDVVAQRIHLILINSRPPSSKSPRIATATVTVHGLSSKGRTIQTFSNQSSSSDLIRALDVSFSSDSENSVSTDLLLPSFTSVKSIELNTVTYADGTMWKVSAQGACRVAPDPIVLISNR